MVKSKKFKASGAARKAAGRAMGRRRSPSHAPARTHHHVRRNPSGGILASPPVRLGLAAGAGAAVSVALDRSGAMARIESPWIRGLVVAIVLALLGRLGRRPAWRQGLTAAAVGALIPAAAEGAGTAIGGAVQRQLPAPAANLPPSREEGGAVAAAMTRARANSPRHAAGLMT